MQDRALKIYMMVLMILIHLPPPPFFKIAATRELIFFLLEQGFRGYCRGTRSSTLPIILDPPHSYKKTLHARSVNGYKSFPIKKNEWKI